MTEKVMRWQESGFYNKSGRNASILLLWGDRSVSFDRYPKTIYFKQVKVNYGLD